ncbi:MAG: cytochrome c [Bdellovibrionaceae bacterium]|nr:cytochrome c [Pseudobdellovibrionaceae bacterium]
MAFSLGFFVYVTVLHPGVNLKEIPDQPAAGPGQQLAGEAAPAAAAVDMTKVEKPWVEEAGVTAHGAKVYANNCAVCHGATGAGDGAAGAALNPKPRNLIEGKWKVGGDSISLFKVLQNGIPGGSMASFAHVPAADRWALVQYIRSITQNKVKDDPAKLETFAKSAK